MAFIWKLGYLGLDEEGMRRRRGGGNNLLGGRIGIMEEERVFGSGFLEMNSHVEQWG
jgi:hypothetical protein